jgi:hypothetical protein
MLCERIASGIAGPRPGGNIRMDLPSPRTFLDLPREDLLALTAQIAISAPVALAGGVKERRCWAELFGSVAVSFARSGDVSAVAAIARAAAHLGLADVWLDEAQAYLLDQQSVAGNFGLLSREFVHLQADMASRDEIYLRLTLEVLWAICEVVAARSERQSQGVYVSEAAA